MHINLARRDLKFNPLVVLETIGLQLIFGYFFYKSLIWTVALTPIFIFYYKKRLREIREKENWNTMLQFKELLIAVNGAIQAGASMENAFISSIDDMTGLFGKDSVIVRELFIIKKGLGNNRRLSDLLQNFSIRAEVTEVKNFANIMVAGQHSGGNIKSIMDTYIHMIDEKVAVLQETNNLMASAKYEQRIMNIVPFLIILYVEITSRGFFDMLYHNIFGNIVMSFCLGIYICAVVLAEKIYRIRL